ncbi:methyltransferase domain-containing protein [Candidatus Uhrbacteria bacterium]|nr:methyltransferase domain-containing protein [Candidatus Uhrbacteria bacterium]
MLFFILGSHPELSVGEIKAVVGDKPVIAQTRQVFVLDEIEEPVDALQERLAGTIKIGQVIGELSKWNAQEAADLIGSFACEAAGKNKIIFGISTYGLIQETRTLGKMVKEYLKQTGRPVRFVTSKEPELSSVIVTENGLLASGGEYVIVKLSDRFLIGQTQTIQDYHGWSNRDFGRPARDAKSGMLPPKLARMMINLSGVAPQGHSILDPFCGSGTVLAEAMLMGFDQLIGSDISAKAVEDTAKNITWLVAAEHRSAPSLFLYQSAIESLTASVKEPVDVIVTETFLGDPKSRIFTDREVTQASAQLGALYQTSARAFASLLKPEGRLVLAAPTFKTKSGFQPIGMDAHLIKGGFKVLKRFDYHRSDQYVGREILVARLA